MNAKLTARPRKEMEMRERELGESSSSDSEEKIILIYGGEEKKTIKVKKLSDSDSSEDLFESSEPHL